MAGTCPTLKYGIPESGATELNINSGRELFRCGLASEDGCVQLYITNVTLEASTVKSVCNTVEGAVAGDVCLQSANGNWKDQAVVNWIAKDGVTTLLPSGSVITKADDCGGGTAVYTHTEGQLSTRVLANICDMNAARDEIILAGKTKLVETSSSTEGAAGLDELEWVLSDLSVNVSATDWEGGSVSYQGFGFRTGGANESYRLNFNWQNGRGEESFGTTFYDESNTPTSVGDIVDTLIDTAANNGYDGCTV